MSEDILDRTGDGRKDLGTIMSLRRDSKGDIRAKFGTDERGSGLILMDDRTDATVRIRAIRSGASLTLIDREGQERLIK